MCLSATVSFTASALLTTGGAAIIVKAVRSNWRYLPIGLMPLFAGIQQFSEGFVWVGVNGGDHTTMVWGAMSFIFFTWFMWPFWIPFSVWVLEPPESRRRPWFLAMTGWGCCLAFCSTSRTGWGQTGWWLRSTATHSLTRIRCCLTSLCHAGLVTRFMSF